MKYALGENTKRNLETLLQSGLKESIILVDAVKDFINYTPIDFCIIPNGGYRTAEQQKELFDKGVSKCDGYLKKSKHQSGLAIDIVPYVNDKPSWESKHAFFLSGAFVLYCKTKGLDITSGADWNSDGNLKDGWDPCHMEIRR